MAKENGHHYFIWYFHVYSRFSFIYSMALSIVSQLFIYPIKSLGGIEVTSAKVFAKGLEFDRRWMLVDAGKKFMTQRLIPEMALFKTSFLNDDKGQIVIAFNGDTLTLPSLNTGAFFSAQIWEDAVEVQEVDKEVSEWFTMQLGRPCSLVAFPEQNTRPVDADYAISSTDQTSLSDGYPILMIGQSSLDELNSRLGNPMPVNRFRPNIVFTGGVPFAEDNFRQFAINKVAMAGVKPCARCVMTTIDQQTGTVGKEPLATLSTYRKIGNKVLFGQNVIPLNEGMIRVGDEILLG